MVKNPFFNLFGGMTQWLYQRFSAVMLYVFTVYLFFYWLRVDTVDFNLWISFFDSISHRLIITFLFLVTFFHGWIGVQHVVEDYIKNPILNQMVYLILLLSMIIQIIFLCLFLLGI